MGEGIIIKGKGGPPIGSKNAEKWTKFKSLRLGLNLLAWMNEKEENIFFEEFLIARGYYRMLTTYLSGKFREFEIIMDRARQIQEMKICKFAMANKLNPTMTIFFLKNNHGYTDGREISLKYSGEHITKSIIIVAPEKITDAGEVTED